MEEFYKNTLSGVMTPRFRPRQESNLVPADHEPAMQSDTPRGQA